jgi:hypothetical protein
MTTKVGTDVKPKVKRAKSKKKPGRPKRATVKAAKGHAIAVQKRVKPKGSALRRHIETFFEPLRNMLARPSVSPEVWGESVKTKLADARKLAAKTRKLLNDYAKVAADDTPKEHPAT